MQEAAQTMHAPSKQEAEVKMSMTLLKEAAAPSQDAPSQLVNKEDLFHMDLLRYVSLILFSDIVIVFIFAGIYKYSKRNLPEDTGWCVRYKQ